MSDRVSGRARDDCDSREWGCYAPPVRGVGTRQPNVRFGARLGGAALVLAGPLLSACGGSSSSTNSLPSAGAAATATGGRGETAPSTGLGGNGDSGAGGGSVHVGDGGEPSVATPGSGGDGGAPMSLPDDPELGGACQTPGALACAGAHQKLTLVCSAGGKWETNQTCPSGQFCSSTPGADLGICKAPGADCAERQPGDAFCASDAITLMQCDADGLAATQVQRCDARCVEGQCAAALPCPENIVYSCDPACPGPNTSPTCFELCPTPASGTSPLLELSEVVDGVKYAIALPAVAPDSHCTCVQADGALQGIAFRVPSVPRGSRWRFTYPKTWEFRSTAVSGESNDYYKACDLSWPFYGSTPGCATIGQESSPARIWLSANAPVTERAAVFVELLSSADATCAP